MKDLPVLISGASSGVRKARAVFFCEKGFRVFAVGRNKSVGNIFQKNALGKIGTLLLEVFNPICGKGLFLFNEILSKSDNEVTHLIADLKSQTAKYSLNSNGIPSGKVAPLVHHLLIIKRPESGYLSGKDANFFKPIDFLFFIIGNRIMLTIMKILPHDCSCSNVKVEISN